MQNPHRGRSPPPKTNASENITFPCGRKKHLCTTTLNNLTSHPNKLGFQFTCLNPMDLFISPTERKRKTLFLCSETLSVKILSCGFWHLSALSRKSWGSASREERGLHPGRRGVGMLGKGSTSGGG